MAISPESPDIGDHVVGLVEKRWNEHRSPLLLSLLGSFMDHDVYRRIKLDNVSLKSYLVQHISDRVRVIHHKDNPSVTAVVPSHVAEDEDILFRRIPRKSQSHEDNNNPRFRPAFWAAFRKPLDDSATRHIRILEPIRFFDLSSEDPTPINHIEIDRRFIAKSDSETIEIQNNIGDWLRENNLEPAPFLAGTVDKSKFLPPNNLLLRLLFSLDSEDLKRVHFPMDIVKKLWQKSL